MLITVTFSDSPGMPGRNRQVSRTISCTRTPATEARYSARTTSGSSTALTLSWIRPGDSFECFTASRSIFSSSAFLRIFGAGRIFL